MTNNPDTQPMVTEARDPMSVEMAELFGLVCKFQRLKAEHDDMLWSGDGLAAIERAADKLDQIVDAVPELHAVFAKVCERERQLLTRTQQTARSADGGREALRRADELIRSIQQTPGGQWVVVSDDDEKLVCETDAFVSKALAALTPLTDEPRQDGGLREALDRIEATIDAAERCMNASPFWDDNSRYAGKALLDYPRSQIAHERQALSRGKP